MKKDNLYNKDIPNNHKFIFDNDVTNVFEDMVHRSVPGYEFLIDNIGYIAKKFYQPNTNIYDLGCSLGACSISVSEKIEDLTGTIFAIDSSESMIKACGNNINNKNIEFIRSDILDTDIINSSVIILNLTLQFISIDKRTELLREFFRKINNKGVIILTEKIINNKKNDDDFSKSFHDFFKQNKGYSQEEIDRKKIALKNTMKIESEKQHEERFMEIGCNSFYKWFQCYNFVSWVLVK